MNIFGNMRNNREVKTGFTYPEVSTTIENADGVKITFLGKGKSKKGTVEVSIMRAGELTKVPEAEFQAEWTNAQKNPAKVKKQEPVVVLQQKKMDNKQPRGPQTNNKDNKGVIPKAGWEARFLIDGRRVPVTIKSVTKTEFTIVLPDGTTKTYPVSEYESHVAPKLTQKDREEFEQRKKQEKEERYRAVLEKAKADSIVYEFVDENGEKNFWIVKRVQERLDKGVLFLKYNLKTKEMEEEFVTQQELDDPKYAQVVADIGAEIKKHGTKGGKLFAPNYKPKNTAPEKTPDTKKIPTAHPVVESTQNAIKIWKEKIATAQATKTPEALDVLITGMDTLMEELKDIKRRGVLYTFLTEEKAKLEIAKKELETIQTVPPVIVPDTIVPPTTVEAKTETSLDIQLQEVTLKLMFNKYANEQEHQLLIKEERRLHKLIEDEKKKNTLSVEEKVLEDQAKSAIFQEKGNNAYTNNDIDGIVGVQAEIANKILELEKTGDEEYLINELYEVRGDLELKKRELIDTEDNRKEGRKDVEGFGSDLHIGDRFKYGEKIVSLKEIDNYDDAKALRFVFKEEGGPQILRISLVQYEKYKEHFKKIEPEDLNSKRQEEYAKLQTSLEQLKKGMEMLTMSIEKDAGELAEVQAQIAEAKSANKVSELVELTQKVKEAMLAYSAFVSDPSQPQYLESHKIYTDLKAEKEALEKELNKEEKKDFAKALLSVEKDRELASFNKSADTLPWDEAKKTDAKKAYADLLTLIYDTKIALVDADGAEKTRLEEKLSKLEAIDKNPGKIEDKLAMALSIETATNNNLIVIENSEGKKIFEEILKNAKGEVLKSGVEGENYFFDVKNGRSEIIRNYYRLDGTFDGSKTIANPENKSNPVEPLYAVVGFDTDGTKLYEATNESESKFIAEAPKHVWDEAAKDLDENIPEKDFVDFKLDQEEMVQLHLPNKTPAVYQVLNRKNGAYLLGIMNSYPDENGQLHSRDLKTDINTLQVHPTIILATQNEVLNWMKKPEETAVHSVVQNTGTESTNNTPEASATVEQRRASLTEGILNAYELSSNGKHIEEMEQTILDTMDYKDRELLSAGYPIENILSRSLYERLGRIEDQGISEELRKERAAKIQKTLDVLRSVTTLFQTKAEVFASTKETKQMNEAEAESVKEFFGNLHSYTQGEILSGKKQFIIGDDQNMYTRETSGSGISLYEKNDEQSYGIYDIKKQVEIALELDRKYKIATWEPENFEDTRSYLKEVTE